MKKVIFISALAIAAAVSCTKSDIVDTKFDEAISFESYIGRDAMTKASVITTGNVGQVYVYGYYTGAANWDGSMTANLWSPLALGVTDAGVGQIADKDKKYWTSADDKYTFLAYAPAPVASTDETPGNGLTVAVDPTNGPTLTYNVPNTLEDQIDLLYATPQINRTKNTWGTTTNLNGVVALGMNHALSRVTVKAKDAETTDLFKFDVKEITLSGNFYTSGNIVLGDGVWSEKDGEENKTTYVFHRNATLNDDGTVKAYVAYDKDHPTELPSDAHKNYADTDNYLMMIPTDADATLTVKYTTIYEGSESKLITKTFTVANEFVQGKAYAIQLDFNNDATAITFTVSVAEWAEVAADDDTNNETEIPGGNPVNGSGWNDVTNNNQQGA